MKFRLQLFLFLFLTSSPLSALAAPQATPANSRISSVTVYSYQALVTREAAVTLRPGLNLVSVDNLPALMNQESLRANGSGPGQARIAGLTVRTVFLERLQEKRIHELEDEIQSLTRKVESLEARRTGLAAQKAFLDSVRVGWSERISRELALGKPSTAELGEAARFVGDGVGKVEEALYDAEAAKKPLQNRIAALQQELEQARGHRGKEVRSVEVAIEADRAMQFNLTLSYLVAQASWQPSYDVRLSADGASAELTYRAQVWQQSGEDWNGVRLGLSTARPEAGGAPPELLPWHVSLYEPPIPLLARPSAKSYLAVPAPAPPQAGMGRDGTRFGAATEMMQAQPMEAGIAEGQTSVLFNVAQPMDIPADGTHASSVIAIAKVPVSAEYLTIPKLSPRVYLKSEVTNDTAYPLLPGEANIFNDAVFTGKSYLKTVAAGEKFDLFFGADDQVKVKREVAKLRKQGGILGSNRITYRVSVELDNFKKRPIKLSLQDQLPLPGNEEIKVSLEEEKPKPDQTRQDGTLVWKLSLAPGEKKKVSYDIVIEYPKGRNITGAE